MDFSAVIVAAGSGSRAGQTGPKQWAMVGGRPLLHWSVEALIEAGAQAVVVVRPEGDEARLAEMLKDLKGWSCTTGGATRAQSVMAGLAALAHRPADEAVLVHDAARPFVNRAHVEGLLDTLAKADGALPALAVADTLKRGQNGKIVATVPRDGLWRAQTPQAFRRNALEAAYRAWPTDAGEPTDDARVVEQAGGAVALAPGDPLLMKLTYPEDFTMAEALVARGAVAVPPAQARVTCIGQGFDAHRFGPGESVWLCGVEIAHDRTLLGHSDADAGLHALTDAILGAIGEGDIGDHFPPTDPKWRGAASDQFLIHAAELVKAKGGEIVNVDVTLICERPRIKAHREAMRVRLAEILALPLPRVSVKATTTEKMGFTGREEGLAAQAIAAVSLPA